MLHLVRFTRLILSGQSSPRGDTMDQVAGYKYEPIREANEIRLLYLHDGKPGDIIRAELEVVRIQKSHYYDAISYTWADENGDTTKCCSLKIGSPGALLPITRSCDSVLRRVRKLTSWIWIDAVCINQQDVQERGKQVDLMPLIYKGASRTFAYVGEAADGSDFVLKNLSEGVWTSPYLLDLFFARPYFSRVWVVQEIALSKSITMMCGDNAVQWTKFMTHEHLQQIYTSSYFETFPTVLRLDQRYLSSSTSILDALLLGRSCNASDPRDKVFGLLGLVSAEGRPPADYSMSTAELYTKIAMYLLKIQRWGLDVILGNLCYRSDRARAHTKNLPSWVPDWSQRGSTLLQRVPRLLSFLKDQDPIFEYNDGPGLFLKGKIVSSLKTLENSADIIQIFIHLSNSRSRSSPMLPPEYSNRRVYVFSPMSKDDIFGDEEWEDPDLDSSSLAPGAFYGEIAFLVARVNGGEAARVGASAQQEGESQEMLGALGGAEDGSGSLAVGDATPRKAPTVLRDGSDGANNFELLGFVHIHSHRRLAKIATWINLLGDEYQPMYTTKLCTIKIV